MNYIDMSDQGLTEITLANEHEHLTCRQQMDDERRRWCLGYHCVACGKATSQYGHSTSVPGVLSCQKPDIS